MLSESVLCDSNHIPTFPLIPLVSGTNTLEIAGAPLATDTPVLIEGVAVALLHADSAGREQQRRFNISGQVKPGQIASVNTGMGPYTEGSNCPVKVVAATVAE